VAAGSYTTVARSAARLTLAVATPSSRLSPRSIRAAQAPQVMPSMGRSTLVVPERSGAVAATATSLRHLPRYPPRVPWDTVPGWGMQSRGGVVPGHTMQKQQLQTRLRRIEGQVRGVARMIDEDKYCVDVVTQVAAIQAALDKVSLGLLDGHIRGCVREEIRSGGGEDKVDELLEVMDRVLRR
jgi:DNA-binding FrmR family transcriptional regulator